MLTNESITFGKYKGFTLGHILKDRNYCKWLIEQDWFKNGYEYLYNRILEYDPKDYFIIKKDLNNFLEDYEYFNLNSVANVNLPLTDCEKICYEFYLDTILILKEKIYSRMENDEENIFNIKAPTKWLQNFEKEKGIPREEFKQFLSAYDLPNITSIVERIKKEGGIEYKGAQSFLIAKEKSLDQEKWWENILKSKYGEDLGTQFKYQNCIFDFINITTNTIFECKLGLKDFNEDQHQKYKITLNKYRIIYLISKNCVIDIEKTKIYTSDVNYYMNYLQKLLLADNQTYLDEIIVDFDVVLIEDLSSLFGN